MPAELTDRQKQALAAQLLVTSNPAILAGMKNDPKLNQAQNLIDYGSSTKPVATGGWGIGEGLSRVASGVAGGLFQRNQDRKWKAKSDLDAEDYANAVKSLQGGNDTTDYKSLPTDGFDQSANAQIAAALGGSGLSGGSPGGSPGGQAAPSPVSQPSVQPQSVPPSAPQGLMPPSGQPPMGAGPPQTTPMGQPIDNLASMIGSRQSPMGAAPSAMMQPPPTGQPPNGINPMLGPQAQQKPMDPQVMAAMAAIQQGKPPPDPQYGPTPQDTGSGRAGTNNLAFERARVGNTEGPRSLGGYNALAYNTSRGANAAGVPQVPLTQMTIGQVLDFQNGPMRDKTRGHRGANDPGSTGAGRYQFEASTLADRASKVFGANYKNVPFTPDVQDKLFDSHYTAHKADGTLGNQWNVYKKPDSGGSSSGYVPVPQAPQEAVPDLPQPMAMPSMVPLPEQVKSDRLKVAMALLNNHMGDTATALSRADPLLQAGWEEEAKAKEDQHQAAVNQSYLQNQTALGQYSHQNNAVFDANVNAHNEALAQNRGYNEKQYAATIQDARDQNLLSGKLQEIAAKPQPVAKPGPETAASKFLSTAAGKKELDDTSAGAKNAAGLRDNAARAQALLKQIPTTGGIWSYLPGQTRTSHNAQVAELRGIVGDLTLQKIGGSLGVGISDADRSFISSTLPASDQYPGQASVDTLRSLQKAGERQSQYWQYRGKALQSNGMAGRLAFENIWQKYINDVSLVKDGKIRDQVVPFDDWVRLNQGK